MPTEQTIWGTHAGRTGDADWLFMKQNVIALGWAEGPDGGVDIIAHRDELGFEPPIIKVQVKSRDGSSGDPEVSQLYGKVDRDEKALFITLRTFTTAAGNFARGRSNLRLIDGDALVDMILTHYEQFDSKYKAVVPLKRVYVPDRGEEEA